MAIIKCKMCGDNQQVRENMEYKICKDTKHKWVFDIDSDYCKVCHCTRMKINNIYHYYTPDGKPFTGEDWESGEKALAEVEKELKALRKKPKK